MVRLNSETLAGSLVFLSTVSLRFMPHEPGFAAANTSLLVNLKFAAVATEAPLRVATRTIIAWLPPFWKNCCTA
jgi:hypothetical protein